jgi:hypothetical protein
VLDIYATSVDYTPSTEFSQKFFATVQNKMHWATHGHTAAEVIAGRVDATKPFMGLRTTRPGGIVRKEDASIAKNYLTEDELQALQRHPMTMRNWNTAAIIRSLICNRAQENPNRPPHDHRKPT